jgi:hypothetical protein
VRDEGGRAAGGRIGRAARGQTNGHGGQPVDGHG